MSRPSSAPPPANSPYDRRFGIIAYTLLTITILFSTYFHHFQPQILNVPSNSDLSTWNAPSLENTVLFERLTADEREQLLSEGVPQGNNMAIQIATDLFSIFLAWLCFTHARRHYGFWMASCFLLGSFFFTGLEETLWILSGRFWGGMISNPLGEVAYGTYWFTGGGMWFLETPISACLGWYYIAYASVLTAGKVFPGMPLLVRAIAGGLIAMLIDLWMDPVQTSPEFMAWVWGKGDVLLFFGIPHYNFLGWFLLIFLFAIFWEKLPQMETNFGRPKATINFFSIILIVPFLVLFFIWAWIFVLGNVFALMGIENAIHIPPGW